MNFDLLQPVRFIVTILTYLGLWRLENNWELLYRAYSYFLHFFFSFLTTASMWASVLTAKELEQFTESLYMALTEAALLAKVLNILKLNKEAVRFLQLVECDDISLRNSDEMKIFEHPHRMFFVVAKFYVSASVVVVVGAFTMVAIGHRWVLPYPAWMPFDLQSELFWYAYGFQFIGMIVTCLANVSIDLLQCYFLHHVSLIYRVIGFRLTKIGVDLDDADNTAEVNTVIMKDVIEIIEVHQLVKRITAKCEHFMSFPIFMQILMSALVLCFTGYQLTSLSPMRNPGQFLGMMDYLLVMGLQIFLPCYYAHQVTIHSGMLSESLYNSNWVVLPQNSKKILYMFMEFLKEPVHLKSGNYFNIGLPMFSKVINNAYSCFAVLIRMKD